MKEASMYPIRLDDGTIEYEGEWLSIEDLSRMIQEKIQAGEMKFSKFANALEALNRALENSVVIEAKLIITKDEYEKLKALGGNDDRECIRMAVAAFISQGGEAGDDEAFGRKAEEKRKTVVKCAKCKTPIEISTDERPVEITCPNCGATGRLKS
jgi:predicted RNA-binding Zn-ribbon protein involved in translation (DUF1610 family)